MICLLIITIHILKGGELQTPLHGLHIVHSNNFLGKKEHENLESGKANSNKGDQQDHTSHCRLDVRLALHHLILSNNHYAGAQRAHK